MRCDTTCNDLLNDQPEVFHLLSVVPIQRDKLMFQASQTLQPVPKLHQDFKRMRNNSTNQFGTLYHTVQFQMTQQSVWPNLWILVLEDEYFASCYSFTLIWKTRALDLNGCWLLELSYQLAAALKWSCALSASGLMETLWATRITEVGVRIWLNLLR